MNIGLLSILNNKVWDIKPETAQSYAKALKGSIQLHIDGLDEAMKKKEGYFISSQRASKGLEDKLYIGNIHYIENHLYWNDEELQDDDQIINVVIVDGPVTRDGGACSYGTKDFRDQVMYANTIPQVVGHVFFINTPGGESACRNDYEMMTDDCRAKGKWTVGFVDGMCCSSGVNLISRLDRVVVMNRRDEFGCIGSMAAFWATPDGAISRDGERYVEIVGEDCPEKNAWWREAAKGEYEKLQAEINQSTKEFHESVRENRPLVEDWMLTGEVFEAEKLIPQLVDEIGDFNRAIECVFELADKKIQPARLTVAAPEPEPKTEPEPEPEPEPGNEPDEMARLNEQQKAAISTSHGRLMMVEGGHVTTDVQTMFGPETKEVATPKNKEDMTDEEKKAAEAEAAKAAEKNEEAAGTEGQEAGAQDAQDGTGEGAHEGAAEGTGTNADTGTGEGEGAQEGPGGGEGSKEDDGADKGEGTGDEATAQPSQQQLEEAQAEVTRITETLHNAEQLVEQKDKEIQQLKSDFEGQKAEIGTLTKERDEANAKLTEKNAEIDKLTRQVSELQAEVKELRENEEPLVDQKAGIPAGNGTGDKPQQKTCRYKRGMSYKEYREASAEK